MAKKEMYRIYPLPGLKKCIDYMRGIKSNPKQKPKIENKKTNY